MSCHVVFYASETESTILIGGVAFEEPEPEPDAGVGASVV